MQDLKKPRSELVIRNLINFSTIKSSFDALQKAAYNNAIDKQLCCENTANFEFVCKISEEFFEFGTAFCNGGRSKCIDFTNEEEEFADIVITGMSYFESKGVSLIDVVMAKMMYNTTRPIKHKKT